MWNNDGYDNNDNNNGSWNNDGYNGGGQGGGNNDDMWKHDGYDNSENNNGGGGNDDWVGDGHDDNYSGSVDYSDGDDDGSTYITADDQWTADGWTENNLGTNKSGNAAEGGDKVDPAPFILGALVAGVIGAAFVVTRKRRQDQDDAHPLEGSLKKRMRLFSGGVLSRKKRPILNDDVEEANGNTPAFIEIGNVHDEMSLAGSVKSTRSYVSRTSGAYKAPTETFSNE